MMARKQKMAILALLSGSVCLLAGVLHTIGTFDLVAAGIVLIIAFPAFVLSLFALWMAGEHAGDIPFMGY
ncbi:MAG: hypothetical protein QHG99_00515 [Methanomicrobiales archaeon]|nr:hypothetical protein [Methanomicrobiales archaeon]